MKLSLISILNDRGPCSSSEFARLIMEKFKITNAAARKRISRDKDIFKLENLNLPNNAQFLYLSSDYCSHRYWTALTTVLIESNSSYGHALAALKQRGGLVTLQQFLTCCGSPFKQKKHIASSSLLKNLINNKLVETHEIFGLGECVLLKGSLANSEKLVNKLKARMAAEDILLKAISSWSKNLGLVSYNTPQLRKDNFSPTVGTFYWDYTAPSYLSPLTTGGKNLKTKPGFLTCDILLEKNITIDCMKAYLKKCETLKGLKNIGKCLHLFVAENYSIDALKLAKDKGIIPATVDTLFGSEVTKALQKLVEVLSNAAEKINDKNDIDNFFKTLGRIDGVAGNLRGALFEYFVAELMRRTESFESIRLNHIYKTSTGQEAEVDVTVITNNRRIRFIECKAHEPDGYVDDKEVEKWLLKRLPIVKKYVKEHPEWQSMEVSFELWTTADFTGNAIQLFDDQAIKTNSHKIAYLSGEKIDIFIRESKIKDLYFTFNNYFKRKLGK
jgi:hypothetical protein